MKNENILRCLLFDYLEVMKRLTGQPIAISDIFH